MANEYSVMRNRQGWIDPTDQDFTLKALMFRQQNYTANKAKVDAIVEQYKSLQLARGVDQDYLNERLQTLVDNINQYGPQDYSLGAVTSSIQNHIGQALDENVMTAVQQTAKIKAYQQEVSQIKEKKPELYNALNEAYGLAPAQEYLQSKKVGDVIKGGLSYTPYADVEGEISKILMDIQKNAKDGVIQVPDGQGGIKQLTVNGKSASELREIALGLMGDRYNSQLKINLWGDTGGGKAIPQMLEQANQQYQKTIADKNNELIQLRAKLTGPLSDAKKEEVKNAIKIAENDITNATQAHQMLQANPEGSLVFLQKDKIANRLGTSLGLLQTTKVEYKADDYFFKAKNLELDTKKLELDFADKQNQWEKNAQDARFKEQELQLEAMKIANQAASDGSKSKSKSGSGGGSSDDEDLLSGAVLGEATVGNGEEDQFKNDAKGMWTNHIQQLGAKANDYSRQVFQNISDIAGGKTPASQKQRQEAQLLIKEYQSKGGTIRNPSIAQLGTFMRTYARANTYSSLDVLHLGDRAVMAKAEWQEIANDYQSNVSAFNTARAQAQRAEAAGLKRAFGNNEVFRETAKKHVPFTGEREITIPINGKKIASANMLMALSKEYNGAPNSPNISDNSIMKIKNNGDGTYKVMVQGKGENDTKNSFQMTVTQANMENVVPGISELSRPAAKFTTANIGTKRLVSPPLTYIPSGSEKFGVLAETIAAKTRNPDLALFLDPDTAKASIVQRTGIMALPEAQRKQALAMVDKLLAQQTLDKYKTAVHIAPTTQAGVGNSYRTITDSRGNEILSTPAGRAPSIDADAYLNQFAPTAIYSMALIPEINKMVKSAISTGELRPTSGIQKLLN